MARKNAAPPTGEDQSKAERVYRDLRRRIRDLKLAPGSRLDKHELSSEYGVSRAPISEAIARLAAEGLIDIEPQSGSFVAPIRPQDIRDHILIRTGLEIEAVRRSAQAATSALIARLEENIRAQGVALRQKDWERLDDLDEAFHMAIMESVDSPRALRLLDGSRAILDRPRYHALPIFGRPDETFAEHRRILDAIRTRDPELAGAAMRIHLSMVAKAIEDELAGLKSPSRKGKKR